MRLLRLIISRICTPIPATALLLRVYSDALRHWAVAGPACSLRSLGSVCIALIFALGLGSHRCCHKACAGHPLPNTCVGYGSLGRLKYGLRFVKSVWISLPLNCSHNINKLCIGCLESCVAACVHRHQPLNKFYCLPLSLIVVVEVCCCLDSSSCDCVRSSRIHRLRPNGVHMQHPHQRHTAARRRCYARVVAGLQPSTKTTSNALFALFKLLSQHRAAQSAWQVWYTHNT